LGQLEEENVQQHFLDITAVIVPRVLHFFHFIFQNYFLNMDEVTWSYIVFVLASLPWVSYAFMLMFFTLSLFCR